MNVIGFFCPSSPEAEAEAKQQQEDCNVNAAKRIKQQHLRLHIIMTSAVSFFVSFSFCFRQIIMYQGRRQILAGSQRSRSCLLMNGYGVSTGIKNCASTIYL
jgi:hypothetical protein